MSSEDTKITLPEVIRQIDDLALLISPDPQPCIEAASSSISYQPNKDTNFEDRGGFVTGVAKYSEEATVHAHLNLVLEEGYTYAIMLHTWRSCSRALPQVQANDQPNRQQIHEKTIEVLQPHIQKLIDFMKFQKRAVETFCDEIKRLSHKERRNDFVSEAYLLTLGKFLNMMFVLDELKNVKASVKNDFSTYKKSADFLQLTRDAETMQQIQFVYDLMANHNKIKNDLKRELLQIPTYEDILIDIINLCVMMFETNTYVLPDEKHMLVKVIGLCLFLIDGTAPDGREVNINKLNAMKRFSLNKIDKIFKQTEVVPLYGDMQIRPFQYVGQCPHYDASKWSHCNSSTASIQGNLLIQLPKIREQHLQYITKLALVGNEISTRHHDKLRTEAENKELYDIALTGLQNLSKWTLQIVELYSWRLSHPADSRANPDCPEEAENYEKATKYNYNGVEKCAIVEVIAMIKDLQHLMKGMEITFSEAINRRIFTELQNFVQVKLRDVLRKSVKKQKHLITAILNSVRDTCADWLKGEEPSDDPALKGKKDPSQGFGITVPRRRVGPSSTQLYMVRTMLESLIDKRMGKATLKNVIDSHSYLAIEEFHKMSFFWDYLLNFSGTLEKCCDLSQLWFREYYLEMTMGARIQFPIGMSMPWIPIEHILETKNASMMEYVLYTFDLYNDSAAYALNVFKNQFLYDELEAEVNLCFSQFVYKLSEQIFAHYKHLAGSIVMDKKFRADYAKLGMKIPSPKANKYESLMKQRHVQLLGRTIDLNHLIGQRVSTALQKSLDVAISRFESSDITGIVELDALLECNRMAHKLLSKYLVLGDFDAMLKEANHNVSAPYGRITLHVFWELNFDFLPNYVYLMSTNRFIRSNIVLTKAPEREDPPHVASQYVWGSKDLNKAFRKIYSLYSGFIGTQHLRAICHLLGYQGVAVVIEELLKVIKSTLHGTLLQYVKTLLNVMPKVCKMPRYEYSSPGVLMYYHANLKDVIQYADLKLNVFSCFNEIGNILIFCLQLEQNLALEEVADLHQAAPFQRIIPKPHMPKKVDDKKEAEELLKVKMKKLEESFEALSVVPIVTKNGTKQQAQLVESGDILTRERLCCGLSIFQMVLHRVRSYLDDPLWYGKDPDNGVMNVDECTEFHRLWSAIQFVYCMPVSDTEFTIEQLFGEGLNWAGCTLIALLGQQRRFEAFDFCHHIVHVNEADNKDEVCNGVPLKKMVCRIKRFHTLNTQIFSMIDKYLTPDGSQSDSVVVKTFPPPEHVRGN